jgi:hypothetical protein
MVTWLHCFWAHGKTYHLGEEMWWSKSGHLMVSMKKEGGGEKFQYTLWKHTANGLLPPMTSHILNFHHLLIGTSTGNQAFNRLGFQAHSRFKTGAMNNMGAMDPIVVMSTEDTPHILCCQHYTWLDYCSLWSIARPSETPGLSDSDMLWSVIPYLWYDNNQRSYREVKVSRNKLKIAQQTDIPRSIMRRKLHIKKTIT